MADIGRDEGDGARRMRLRQSCSERQRRVQSTVEAVAASQSLHGGRIALTGTPDLVTDLGVSLAPQTTVGAG